MLAPAPRLTCTCLKSSWSSRHLLQQLSSKGPSERQTVSHHAGSRRTAGDCLLEPIDLLAGHEHAEVVSAGASCHDLKCLLLPAVMIRNFCYSAFLGHDGWREQLREPLAALQMMLVVGIREMGADGRLSDPSLPAAVVAGTGEGGC